MKLLLMLGALLMSPFLPPNPNSDIPIRRSVSSAATLSPGELRANYLITTADDFIVDVYQNGKPVPDSKRKILEERFGATAERIDTPVKAGDWLVFNVVNNRLRWGGAYYFGLAGCLNTNQFGFVSRLDSARWSVCDKPGDVEKFIAEKEYLSDRPAQPVAQPWEEGDLWMRRFAGEYWNGSGLWGNSRNTWIKVIVE